MRNAYSYDAVKRCVKASDARDFGVDLAADREALVDSAMTAASAEPSPIASPHQLPLGTKTGYYYKDYATNLLIRATTRYLSQRFRVSVPNRDKVVRSVIDAMSDGSPFHIIRRDITSFYENIPTAVIRDRLLFDTAIPKQVRRHLRAYFSISANPEKGLPRGIGLTTMLAELAMHGFDQAVREIPGVYRYFRYSDDILVFCTGDLSNIEGRIASLLPETMTFNNLKCTSKSFYPESDQNAVGMFDYLGYRFKALVNTPKKGKPRTCHVSVAPAKVNKIKTRIILSLKKYHSSEPMLLLYRMRYLSGNFRVTRVPGHFELKGTFTRSGIYYNYRRCGQHDGPVHTPTERAELAELDWFYQNLLTSPTSSHSNILQSLPPGLAAQLRGISFRSGHALRLQARVPSGIARRVKSAWRNH